MRFVSSLFAVLVFCAPASASVTYNLTNDFSNASNPNGAWKFAQAAVVETHFVDSTGNGLDPALANGYWGHSATSYSGSIMKTTANGSADSASGYSNNDFLAGDVISHSTNPGDGGTQTVDWIAPFSGTITYSGSVWYAHSPVTRSNDFVVNLNGGSALASGTVTPANTRSNAITFASSGTVVVGAGDVLALQISPTAGQQFGSLSGLAFNIVLTPEPATLSLIACAPLALIRRRRAN